MQNKRWSYFLVLLFIGILLLGACRENDDVSDADSVQQTEQAAPEQPALAPASPEQPTPVAGVIVEEDQLIEVPLDAATEEPNAENGEEAVVEENGRILTVWVDEMRLPALESAAAAFAQAVDDVTVIVEPYTLSDIRNNMLMEPAPDTLPDIIVGTHTWLGELVVNELLTPIELGDKVTQFVPLSLDAFTINNQLYGMPNNTDNVAFFINQDLVPECPTTWSEVLAISRVQAAGNDDESATNRYGFVRMEGNAYHFFPMQSAFGGYIFGLDDNNNYNIEDIGINSTGSLAAADYYTNFLVEGLQPISMNLDVMLFSFESGQSAMTIIGSWALPIFRNAEINYKICDIPSETERGQALVEVEGFMVTAFTDDPLLAERFLTDFVATPETMQAIAENDFRLSAFLPTRSSADPDLITIGDVGANGIPIPGIPEMASVWEPWESAVTFLARQQETPQTAFNNAAEQIRTSIENDS